VLSPQAISATLRAGTRSALRKIDAGNWTLGWHQDRTIVVVKRRDVEGFGPWTVKAGMVHVEPSPALQASMITCASTSIQSTAPMRRCW
jgi:hypothetical protein